MLFTWCDIGLSLGGIRYFQVQIRIGGRRCSIDLKASALQEPIGPSLSMTCPNEAEGSSRRTVHCKSIRDNDSDCAALKCSSFAAARANVPRFCLQERFIHLAHIYYAQTFSFTAQTYLIHDLSWRRQINIVCATD